MFTSRVLWIPACATLAGVLLLSAEAPPGEVWRFDRIDQIGGYPTKVLGHPRVVETPLGKAVEFNGVDDALYVDVHPLAGAETFTWEVIFRPGLGGQTEQRFFHLSERDPKTGEDTQTRLLFEIRVAGENWFLDSFALSGNDSKTLVDPQKLHPLGAWYHAALVYDGHELRNYVNGVPQRSAELHLAPQGAGHSSIGTRIEGRYYFKGAILLARMTRRALDPAEFLQVAPETAKPAAK